MPHYKEKGSKGQLDLLASTLKLFIPLLSFYTEVPNSFQTK